MKKLSMYAMLVSILITVSYSWNIFNSTDIVEFAKASTFALVGEIGLWCAYYYARDYEACKAHEAHQDAMRKSFEKAMNKLGDGQ